MNTHEVGLNVLFEYTFLFLPAEVDHLHVLILVLVAALVLIALVVGGIYLYRRRSFGSMGAYESARYSRTNSAPSEEAEENILVSDMELNEQGE